MADKIVTAQKLKDADKDCDALDQAVSGGDSEYVRTRRGKEYPTMPNAIRQIMENGGFMPFTTEAELLAYVPNISPSAAKAMDTKKVWLWKNDSWHDTGSSELDQAKENTKAKLDAIDSYRVNAGKSYPFLRKVRAGINHNANQQMLDSILDIHVYGADPKFYYRLELIENGSTSLGGHGNGIRIAKYPKSTYETVGNSTVIHNNTSTVGLSVDYLVKGIQKNLIKCDSDDVVLEITIDVDKLPAYGTAVAAANPSTTGYNWILDPVCYDENLEFMKGFELKKLGLVGVQESNHQYLENYSASHLRLNTEKNYPMQFAKRNATSPNTFHPYIRSCVLDAKVINARKGYFYRLSFLQNGADGGPLGVTEKYGISITRIPESRLSEGYEQNIVTYKNEDIQLKPDRTKGGVQTFYIDCPNDPMTTVKLVIDVDKMPADGTAFTITTPTSHGYNNIIDPVCYEYADAFDWKSGEVLFEYVPDTSKVMVTYLSGKKWYRIHCARKSINNTFQPLGFSFADAFTVINELIPVEKADLKLRTEAGSDWHAPITFTADSNFDDVPVIYTSGAHGTDGGSFGDATAEQVELIIIVDGTHLNLNKAVKCKAKSINCIVTNKVMAGNTYASKRFCLEQNYRYDLSEHGLWISSNYVALEDITMLGDNGCQHYLAGATPVTANSILFWGGNQSSRQVMKNTPFDSGKKSDFPKVMGVTTRHAVAGDFTSWVDVNYGIGNREFLNEDRPLYQFPRADGKIYPRLLSELKLKAGESYCWRGGYYWGTQLQNSSFHDVVQKTQAGDILVKSNGKYAVVG